MPSGEPIAVSDRAYSQGDDGAESCHIKGMKVDVSIPDLIFAEAEDLAKQFGTSPSELYRRAPGEFVSRPRRKPHVWNLGSLMPPTGRPPIIPNKVPAGFYSFIL
jgi:hypothetical protein